LVPGVESIAILPWKLSSSAEASGDLIGILFMAGGHDTPRKVADL
jgi:hypothetical protein